MMMIEDIEDSDVKSLIEKKKKNIDEWIWFEKWSDFKESFEITYILKSKVDEIKKLKLQIAELRKQLSVEEVEETKPEIIEETPEEIIEPEQTEEKTVEEYIEEESKPIEEIKESYICKKCGREFPNKGLLKAHENKCMEEENGKEIDPI